MVGNISNINDIHKYSQHTYFIFVISIILYLLFVEHSWIVYILIQYESVSYYNIYIKILLDKVN